MKFNFLVTTKTLIVLCFVFSISSCGPYVQYPHLSQVPLATNHDITTQKKMQALHHWQLLADDIALQVKNRIENSLYLDERLYVAPSGTTDFEKNFRELLISSLVRQEVRVTNNQGNHFLLTYKLDMLRHNKRFIITKSGIYQALAPDVVARRKNECYPACYRDTKYYPVVNVEAGKHTIELPRAEVMITTSLIFNREYLFRDSSIYYINDKDWQHYKQDPSYNPGLVKKYYMVDN